MFDTELLGRSRRLAVSALEHHLLPWARWSLLMVVPTGVLMFVAHATEMAANPHCGSSSCCSSPRFSVWAADRVLLTRWRD
jgi:hypothetical protein